MTRTREDTIIHLGTLKTVIKDIPKYNGKAIDESLSIAIKSLEAWDKVLEEICQPRGFMPVQIVRDIINKHLQEVSDNDI